MPPSATRIMTTGGDARIILDPATGLNRYHSAPAPCDVIAYASSTANDISRPAFAHVTELLEELGPELSAPAYAMRLDMLRHRIRHAYGLSEQVEIVFAPSGTDLEYVALTSIAGRGNDGTHNVLLGADEVGSGCIHSAHGRYFAESTALGTNVEPGRDVKGLDAGLVDLLDVPVRDSDGHARPSTEIAAAMDESIRIAAVAGRHALLHVVHGSKTGLILPLLADIDRLRTDHGPAASFVVDACQARITGEAIRDYLERDAIVFITGSKFMGGPPFSGFALVPPGLAANAPPLAEGLATIFRRAEWPDGWSGAEILPQTANPGLLLRLEASLFELERFVRLPASEVARIIEAFRAAIRALTDRLGVSEVLPYPSGERAEALAHPLEMRTLATLDLSALNGGSTFAAAQGWHGALAGRGIRLGQPVKCVKLPGGDWGATLRIGLSMPMMADRAGLPDEALSASFEKDMETIAAALSEVVQSPPRSA